MPPERIEEKSNEKQGFFALGMKEGDAIPLFEELGIPGRVGAMGEALWKVHADDLYELARAEPYRDYLWKKWDWILNSMFRGWNLLMRALGGFPVRLLYGWDVFSLPAADPQHLPTLLERAPVRVQEMALRSAFEYLKPQRNS